MIKRLQTAADTSDLYGCLCHRGRTLSSFPLRRVVHHVVLQDSYSVAKCAGLVASIKAGARPLISLLENNGGLLTL